MDCVGKEEDGVKGGRTREGLERCGLKGERIHAGSKRKPAPGSFHTDLLFYVHGTNGKASLLQEHLRQATPTSGKQPHGSQGNLQSLSLSKKHLRR